MRFVIYDDETLEPITVINLKGFGEKDIIRRGRVWRVPVPRPISFEVKFDAAVSTEKMEVIDLFFEPFVRTKVSGEVQRAWMCFTKATELAMLLNPSWLPGQRSTIEYLQEQNDGLTKMLMKVLSL